MQDGRAPRYGSQLVGEGEGLTSCRIKNRAPAAVQITAEQLLREVRAVQSVQDRVDAIYRPKSVKRPLFVHPSSA